MPVAPAAARIAQAAARPLARSRVGRLLVFGGFVGMRRPDAVAPPLGERMIRHAAAAAPALEDYVPMLHGLDLREPSALVGCRSLTVWGDIDVHARNGAIFAWSQPRFDGRCISFPATGEFPFSLLHCLSRINAH